MSFKSIHYSEVYELFFAGSLINLKQQKMLYDCCSYSYKWSF